MRTSVDIEAVILTGGSSRRMGSDKANLMVGNQTLLSRTIEQLAKYPTTVLGPQGMADENPGEGPMAALAAYEPRADLVFVAACDMPLFDGRIVSALSCLIEDVGAVVPVAEARLQPLCALYRTPSLHLLRDLHRAGKRRMMAWIERLNVRQVDESDLTVAGINPLAPLGANTPQELRELLAAAETDASRQGTDRR